MAVKGAKKVAYGAVFTALGVILLSAGVLLESLDASLAVAASMLITVAVIEFQSGFSLGIWLAVSLLSLILFPLNSAAWLFGLFLGWYPVFKKRIEQIHYVLAWSVKLSAFNVSAVAYWFVFTKVLMLPFEETGLLLGLLWIGANAVFVIYDLVLTRMITIYIFRLRSRLGFKG